MKKLILVVVLFVAFAGVATGSSLNGDYKGNPIVLVKSNGKVLETDEVPAMIYDGHTVVPISLLRQIGASVTWDTYSYTVDVELHKNTDLIKQKVILSNIYKKQDDLNKSIGLYMHALQNFLNERLSNDLTKLTTPLKLRQYLNDLIELHNSQKDSIQSNSVTTLDSVRIRKISEDQIKTIDLFTDATIILDEWYIAKNNDQTQATELLNKFGVKFKEASDTNFNNSKYTDDLYNSAIEEALNAN